MHDGEVQRTCAGRDARYNGGRGGQGGSGPHPQLVWRSTVVVPLNVVFQFHRTLRARAYGADSRPVDCEADEVLEEREGSEEREEREE